MFKLTFLKTRLVLIVIIPILFEIMLKMYFVKNNEQVETEDEEVAEKETSHGGKHISFDEAFENAERFNPRKKDDSL